MSGEYVELTAADLAERWRPKTLNESVDQAMNEYNDQEEYATADAALRHLLACAWNELQNARRSALNGSWSMQCDFAVHKIMGLTDLVGPIDWGEVQVDLILDGMYERIHERAGYPTPLTDLDRARAREVLERRRG